MDVQPRSQGQVPVLEAERQADAPATSLGSALRALPRQYFDVLVNPTTTQFLNEKRRATWGLVVAQLIIAGLLIIIVSLLVSLLQLGVTGQGSGVSVGIVLAGAVVQFIFAVVIFLVQSALQFLLARLLGGNGTFAQQCYLSLLITVPLGVVMILTWSAPGLNLLFIIYILALNVIATRAVHTLSGGRAALTMLGSGVIAGALAIGVVLLGLLALIR